MKRAVSVLAVLFLFSACSKQEGVLGRFERREVLSIAAAKAAPQTSLNLAGKLVEKCPVAGCWFYVQDATGRIKVDTRNAGFVVLDVPIGTRLEVSGTLRRDGAERIIEAQGLRF